MNNIGVRIISCLCATTRATWNYFAFKKTFVFWGEYCSFTKWYGFCNTLGYLANTVVTLEAKTSFAATQTMMCCAKITGLREAQKKGEEEQTKDWRMFVCYWFMFVLHLRNLWERPLLKDGGGWPTRRCHVYSFMAFTQVLRCYYICCCSYGCCCCCCS